MNLSDDEKIRYSRQTILPMVGLEGQRKLKNARILMIGAGGLGSSPAMYLAACGVGTIGIMDADTVALSNLHRQVIHSTPDLDSPKVLSAAQKLKSINPHVHIVTYQERLTAQNAKRIFADYDLVMDGTDNLPSRYLINDACFFLKKPFIFGGVFQFEGQVSMFGAHGPCYRCIFREAPAPEDMPSCAQAGVIGVIPGIIGLMQANEAIKWICQIGESLLGRLLIFDALGTHWREVKVKKDPACPLCGKAPTIHEIKEYTWECSTQTSKDNTMEITVKELKELKDKQPDLYILDVREPMEWDIAHIDGSHLKPMSTLAETFTEIPQDKTIYCLCHLGGRSARVADFLRSKGYPKVVNILGGIAAWSHEIDPTLAQY